MATRRAVGGWAACKGCCARTRGGCACRVRIVCMYVCGRVCVIICINAAG